MIIILETNLNEIIINFNNHVVVRGVSSCKDTLWERTPSSGRSIFLPYRNNNKKLYIN